MPEIKGWLGPSSSRKADSDPPQAQLAYGRKESNPHFAEAELFGKVQLVFEI